MRLLLPLFMLFAFLSSCGPAGENNGVSTLPVDSLQALKPFVIPHLDSAVIYCWCFKNGTSQCMTFAAVKPEALCDSSNRLLAISGPVHLPSFTVLLKNAQLQENKWGARDARFVIKCFSKDSSFLLTYADYDDHTLWIDGNRELKCKRPVLAWIMNEMGLTEIDCPN